MCQELYNKGDVTAEFQAAAYGNRIAQVFANSCVQIERYDTADPDADDPQPESYFRITIDGAVVIDDLRRARSVFDAMCGIAVGRGYARV